jgi:phage shock protein PspC (stress-responsive transcriptional regulator)
MLLIAMDEQNTDNNVILMLFIVWMVFVSIGCIILLYIFIKYLLKKESKKKNSSI